MSVSDQFSTFCTNIAISQPDVSSIATIRGNIVKRLNKDFWEIENSTKNSLYVGSYGRETDIVVSDIDLIMILPYETYKKYNGYLKNGQSALLQAVKTSIAVTYPTTFLKGDGQVVKINFQNGISFEVVPCFENRDKSFTFPDSNGGGSWKTTNPRPEIEAIRKIDSECNYNLKMLCKMIRAWKHYNSVPMGGLLIDTLAAKFLPTWQYRDKSYTYYDWMVRDFFKHLSEIDPTKKYWLAIGSGQYIYRKGSFEYKAKLAYNKSLEAIQKQTDGYEFTSKKLWREIFGTNFPS